MPIVIAKQTHPLLRDRAAGLPPAATHLLGKAAIALSRKEAAAAEQAAIGVLALVPDCVEALRLLGLAEHMRGDCAAAVATFQQALALNPDDALIRMNLGTSQYDRSEFEAALGSLRRACDLAADFAPAWFNLGKMLKMRGRADEAIIALQRALDLDRENVAARMTLAGVQASLGAVAEASANYREVLRLHPDHPDAWMGLSNLKVVRFGKDDLAGLQRVLQFHQLTAQARVSLSFALARALEDQADYREAFRVFGKANALQRRQVNWNASAASSEVDAILDVFARPLSGATDVRQGEEVIFIVCLPRSGSTLTEQILASHPQVEGANELTDLQQVIDDESARRGVSFPQWAAVAAPADWTRLGREYLARTEQWRQHKPRFTDKNLINWRLVGAAMAMLPGARVVNSRRDAVENCFGCYRQLFTSGNDFSYDLDDIASYWRDYDRLSRHWQRLFPESFFEQVYESLQTDPEAQIRRLLAFCGLEYDPACLDFHLTERVVRTASAAQVRQPLRRDTSRGALYGKDLDRLRVLLGVDGAARQGN